MPRKKKAREIPPFSLAQVPTIDREKFLDMLAEALWPRIEQKVQEEIDGAIDNIYIGH